MSDDLFTIISDVEMHSYILEECNHLLSVIHSQLSCTLTKLQQQSVSQMGVVVVGQNHDSCAEVAQNS